MLPLQSVLLLYNPFTTAIETDCTYLLELDPDPLLSPFQHEGELELRNPFYGNWEGSGSDGHTAGGLSFRARAHNRLRPRHQERPKAFGQRWSSE